MLRHFDNPLLSPEDNNIHLERDKVILYRSKSKQLTILKKCKSSYNCKKKDSGIIDEVPQQHSEPLYQGILGGISRENCFLSNRNHCRTNFRHCSSSHVEVPHYSMRSLETTSKRKPKVVTTRSIRTQHSETSNQISKTTGFLLSNSDGQYGICLLYTSDAADE